MLAAPSATPATIAISCLRIEFLPVIEDTIHVLGSLTYQSVESCSGKVQNFKRAVEILNLARRSNITKCPSPLAPRVFPQYAHGSIVSWPRARRQGHKNHGR